MNENTTIACLLCKYFKPIIPDDWKQGMDDKWRQANYNRFAVAAHIKAKQHHVAGKCTLNPVHVDVHTLHSCGQFEPDFDPTIRKFIWGELDRERERKAQKDVLDRLNDVVESQRYKLALLRKQIKTMRERAKAKG